MFVFNDSNLCVLDWSVHKLFCVGTNEKGLSIKLMVQDCIGEMWSN